MNTPSTSTEPSNETYDYMLKYLIIGNSGVGKSCILIQFSDNTWNESYVTTIGVDFKIKTFERNGKSIKLQIWDTAGQERFRNITSSYYKGAQGIMMVYDITDNDSFLNLNSWLAEIDKNANANVYKILIGNKKDLASQRKVTEEQAKAFAAQYEMTYIETSAKDAENVQFAFMKMTEDIISQTGEKKYVKKEDNLVVNTKANSKNISTGCCK